MSLTQRRPGPRWAATALVVLLVACAACGGDSKKGATAEPKVTIPSLARSAPELARFAEIAVVTHPPVVIHAGPSASSADLEGGVKLSVPAGAFANAVDLQVVSGRLAMQKYRRQHAVGVVVLGLDFDAGRQTRKPGRARTRRGVRQRRCR